MLERLELTFEGIEFEPRGASPDFVAILKHISIHSDGSRNIYRHRILESEAIVIPVGCEPDPSRLRLESLLAAVKNYLEGGVSANPTLHAEMALAEQVLAPAGG